MLPVLALHIIQVLHRTLSPVLTGGIESRHTRVLPENSRAAPKQGARGGDGLEQNMVMVGDMLYWFTIVQAGDPLCVLKRLTAMNVRAARRYEC